MRFLARPARGGRSEELLKAHLAAVAQMAERNVLTLPISGREHLAALARLCGLTHDFGKYTTYFQEKLPPLEKKPPEKSTPTTPSSPRSSGRSLLKDGIPRMSKPRFSSTSRSTATTATC